MEERMRGNTRITAILIILALVFAGCGDDDGGSGNSAVECDSEPVIMTTDDGVDPGVPQVFREILQIVSPTEIVVWGSDELTQAEFDAIELPPGWFKNNPLEVQPDGGVFARSPDASMDGPLTIQEHFGHEWAHVATIVELGIPIDDQGLLLGNLVAKFNEISFDACRTVTFLISPEGDTYVRATRDPGRPSEASTLPSGWRQVDYLTREELTIRLPNPTLVMRTNIQDSFQGPVSEIDIDL